MGPEPLEWLHVSLINTATALDTVPLINVRDIRERDRQEGKWRESAENFAERQWKGSSGETKLVGVSR